MGMIGYYFRIKEDEVDKLNRRSSNVVHKYLNELPEKQKIDIDKSWEAILYLLTGHNADLPIKKGSMGGVVLGYKNLSYPKRDEWAYRSITDDEVKNLSKKLKNISSEDLKAKYNSDELNEKDVYPIDWEPNSIEYIIRNYETLSKFIQGAANNDEAVVSLITF